MSKMKTVYLRNGVLYKEGDVENSSISTTVIVEHLEPQQEEQQKPTHSESLSIDPVHQKSPRRRRWRRNGRPNHPWAPLTTEIFLEECVKRKNALRQPKQHRRTIFSEIRLEMLEKGFSFDEQSLDRKFRNLKIHYLYVKKNNKGRKANRIMWPYYQQMNQIFPDEKIRNNQVLSSLHTKPEKTIRKLSSSNRHGDKPRKIDYSNQLENLRNELIHFEERRTIAIEAIATELIESNRLNREKLALLKAGQRITRVDNNENC